MGGAEFCHSKLRVMELYHNGVYVDCLVLIIVNQRHTNSIFPKDLFLFFCYYIFWENIKVRGGKRVSVLL